MAKKKTKSGSKPAKKTPQSTLPQNILPVGEHSAEDKGIYISQKVYKQIHKFTQNKTTNESGGMLIGSLVEEFGKVNVLIEGFVEAKYSDGTPTTLTFTHETWNFVHKEIDKKYPGMKIVGWIHTHPNFGIFLSDYDKFIHENFFNDENQLAYVVDPIQNIEGFYRWQNGAIEKNKGFYIFDKTGVDIKVDVEAAPEPKQASGGASSLVRDVITGLLALCVVLLFFANASLSKELEALESKHDTETQKIYNTVDIYGSVITSLDTKLDAHISSTEATGDTGDTGTEETEEQSSEETDGETESEESTEETGGAGQ